MRSANPYLLVLGLLAASACGTQVNDPGSFHVRTASPHALAAAAKPADGLVLTIQNSLPVIETPEGQQNGVTLINAKLCAAPTEEVRARRVEDANGRLVHAPIAGSAKCMQLSPTIFGGARETYHIERSVLTGLLNEDYQALRVELFSSSQTTRISFPCNNNLSLIAVNPNELMEHGINVTGNSRFWFNCSPLH